MRTKLTPQSALAIAAILAVLAIIILIGAQDRISFPAQDGWIIHADLYGASDRGVVLVHGGGKTKSDWKEQAQILVKAGFRVLAIDLRGFGLSRDGPLSANREAMSFDVLAAVRYLRKTGAKTVAVVGASIGGDATEDALGLATPGEIDRAVLLAHSAYGPPKKLIGRKLFIVTRDDANDAGLRLPKIRRQYQRSPEPKELVVLDGSAHAQFVFGTDQGERLMREILRFLSAR
ncbi:MAG: alpha/beta hydrolase [Pseudomonadota bacterium]|nr:alpha/beta hydrolase [Pseudomonadota bacterium]